jgi:hypothetical protein
LADGLPEFVDGAHGHGAQVRLEFGEGHFDRIEVGAVGRQKHKRSTSRSAHGTERPVCHLFANLSSSTLHLVNSAAAFGHALVTH